MQRIGIAGLAMGPAQNRVRGRGFSPGSRSAPIRTPPRTNSLSYLQALQEPWGPVWTLIQRVQLDNWSWLESVDTRPGSTDATGRLFVHQSRAEGLRLSLCAAKPAGGAVPVTISQIRQEIPLGVQLDRHLGPKRPSCRDGCDRLPRIARRPGAACAQQSVAVVTGRVVSKAGGGNEISGARRWCACRGRGPRIARSR
jgi:hypothetical protein